MAALDAHLRHTALSSAVAEDPSQNVLVAESNGSALGGGDPFWEAGGLLLAAVIEHASFAAGAVLCASRSTAVRHRRMSRRNREQENVYGDDGDGSSGQQAGDASSVSPENVDNVPALNPPPPSATKMYMAVVYPLFFRLLAAFVMIWDRQVAILNTIALLVATMQFVALSAVVGGPAAVSGMGEGGVAAAAIFAGLACKMGARGVLCLFFGSDSRTLRML